ncbi:MAG: 4Fe-4S cluster-binding domain-containing protein [Candidatus Sabulitectum sp.]|nr:4Fe-4S cluster-binding domain-containing protein [Candidatus Sabulitectum sp.]
MVTSLYLMPTGNCNCVCEYCYFPAGLKRGDPALFMRIAESFTKHIINSNPPARPQIRFTGGEPWLEKYLLFKTTDYFFKKVPDGLVIVNTNGTILPADRLRFFQGEKRLIHVVSLDGPEILHDSRRRMADGKGSFHRVVAGVKMLMDLDLPVYLNAVLDARSSTCLPDYLSFISEELGLKELSISLLHRDKNPLSPEERYELLENAYSKASRHSIRLGGHHRLLLGHWIPELQCTAGNTTALVDPNGMIHACQRFVGRVKPDCLWTDDFDWEGFKSKQACGPVCGSRHDYHVGKKLYDLYRNQYPEYLYCHPLDRSLFGVLS